MRLVRNKKKFNRLRPKKQLMRKINDIQIMNDQLTLQKNKMDDNKIMKMKISNFIQNNEQEK